MEFLHLSFSTHALFVFLSSSVKSGFLLNTLHSILKHPHDFVLPFFNEYPLISIIFPQSHKHFHITSPLLENVCLHNTSNLPYLFPDMSGDFIQPHAVVIPFVKLNPRIVLVLPQSHLQINRELPHLSGLSVPITASLPNLFPTKSSGFCILLSPREFHYQRLLTASWQNVLCCS